MLSVYHCDCVLVSLASERAAVRVGFGLLARLP